jgi:Fic-DOC domain mobile mystery protein B
MTGADLVSHDGLSRITNDERLKLVPSLSTRAQIEDIERIGIQAARVWAMRPSVLRRDDLLTETFARELHRRMFAGIWKGAGKYRISAREPGWEPGQISEGVRIFMDDAEGWLRFSTYPVHESAVRLHHRLVSVRPWSNGNRRHARLMADIVVSSQGEPPLKWGQGADAGARLLAREGYREAMKAADDGNFSALVEFAGR